MEALILYFVLFFPSVFASAGALPEVESIPYSMIRESTRFLTYTLPSLVLIWYLVTDKRGVRAIRGLKPEAGDFKPFAIGLICLICIGFGISYLVTFLSETLGLPIPPQMESPSTILGWTVLTIACLGTGYLEETYFRYYFLSRLKSAIPQTSLRIILSTGLFSLCHLYEGPLGILNSVLAGILLSVLFCRYRSLHGIAWAHGAYNLFVYAIGTVL